MQPVVIIQARLGSTRYPRKVLHPVCGRPLLQYQLERLRRVGNVKMVGVATTNASKDEPLVECLAQWGVPVFRGDENDVLGRFAGAAAHWNAESIVRVTADCPLIDPNVTEQVIQKFLESKGALDYVSNTLERTYPRGLDVEVFSRRALTEADREARDPWEREHVTPFIYRRPDRYRLANLAHSKDLSRHRWTVDTSEDMELIQRVLTALYPALPEFTMHDVLTLLDKHPEWVALNQHVQQAK